MNDDTLVRHLFAATPGVSSRAFGVYTRLRAKEGATAASSSSAPVESPTLRLEESRAPLFRYQEELVERLVKCAETPGSRALLSLPTGGGKTRTALVAVSRLFEGPEINRVLWLAPTKELLDQATGSAREVWQLEGQRYTLHLVRASSVEKPALTGKSITFMTPQMLVQRVDEPWNGYPQVLIFDEAHQAVAPTYFAAIEILTRSSTRPLSLIGLSATPGRTNDREIEELVSFFSRSLIVAPSLGSEPVEALQRDGVLARVVFHPLGTDYGSGVWDKRFQGMTNDELELNPSRFEAILEKATSLGRTDKVLVFAGSIRHANAIAAALIAAGTRAGVVSSRIPAHIRATVIRGFRAGRIPVVVNKDILTTGFDLPSVRHAILTVPVRSSVQFEQIAGRVGRGPAVGGSAQGDVWQFENHLAMHGYPMSYRRFRDYGWDTGEV